MTDALYEQVDEWFAKHTGLGGCSRQDVSQLSEIFYGTDQLRAYVDATCELRGAQQGWMPIETAPKDGTYYLATNGQRITTENQPPNAAPGYWEWNPVAKRWVGSAHFGYFCATHWRPMLSLPPSTKEQA